MPRLWSSLAFMCAALGYGAASYADPAAGSVDEVIQWNKALLTIVRTPGAQPATVHSTRSFAILHAAVYDAVNAIDASHQPYLVRVEHVSPHASQDAAAAAAAAPRRGGITPPSVNRAISARSSRQQSPASPNARLGAPR